MNLYKQVDNKVELCIFPWLENELRKVFGKEMESGNRSVLSDGRLYFVFLVSEEKAGSLQRLAEWGRYWISES